MRFLLLFTALLLGSPILAREPTPRPDPARFAKEISVFEAQPADKGGIVFTGSSSIRLWKTLKQDFPDLPVLNRGFGSSVANDLTVYFDTLITRHEPKIIVTYTGSNDINAKLTPEEAFTDYTGFLDQVHTRFPKTRVLLTSVKIGEKRITQIPQVHALNELLKAWSESKDWVQYIDCTSYLADSAGKPIRKYYAADLLHLSPEGYAEWTKILSPILHQEWAKVSGH
ncbi:Lysophospholipase L1 [Prosthecobacter debontii]|uniref:Lysophospholipase L1 n=1 Tax=Prosthecobacter debontii TaxID=48467 RepID=A0A1T4WWR3_9BACT|nr:GDSL-type esterase/lipase family protein [Prosthecobacter debontii]SKA81783.1 Lysophospholipase L1 [Prosthecobacter debontii]